MKKLYVLFLFMSIATFMVAQNQIGSTGNVGIGTLTPLYPLEVFGQARFHGITKMDTSLIVEDSIVVESGRVLSDLKIDGSLRMTSFALNGMQANRPVFVNEAGELTTIGNPCRSDGTGGEVPYWQYDLGMIFVDCPKDVKVGIGTNDPVQNLHVTGSQYITNSLGIDIKEPETKLDVRSGIAFNDIAARFLTSTTGLTPQTNNIMFIPRLGTDGFNTMSVENDHGIIWSDRILSGEFNKYSGLVIGPANSNFTNPGIRIAGSGYLGVGNNNPQKRIEISNGALAITGGNGFDGSVRFLIKDNTDSNHFMKFSNTNGIQFLVDNNGKLYAHEVEVKLGSFPDYVFEDDYKLRTLSEVEEFIIKNKHLPGVPDAETVVEEGLNLGDMDVILMEKVEELTLYLIEQQKQIELLKEELNKLQTK